ncbi:hypothetical protein [Pseudomonas gingeri]|uniref:Uncharacterized protein n=1 Tax=Pseudomonas gingeri TaxID=117681 RepID=A0A7Y7WMB4_9PSED|nr:hypothetical protein [Pseudomonas gingeri]NWB51308.1 hypothetical protein [Pseudomonas gingeri]
MIISKPELVLNPYEWLPGYGESKVSFHSEGPNVLLDIEYEKEVLDDYGNEIVLSLKREIVFKCARAFIKVPFPESAIFEFEGESSGFRLGELTEFTQSEWVSNSLSAWCLKSSHTPPKVRHFSIQFMSENIAFHILAEEVLLSDERSSEHPQ